MRLILTGVIMAGLGLLVGCGDVRSGEPADAGPDICGLHQLDGVVWDEDPNTLISSFCRTDFEVRFAFDPEALDEAGSVSLDATIEGRGMVAPRPCIVEQASSPEIQGRSCRWPILQIACEAPDGGDRLGVEFRHAVTHPSGQVTGGYRARFYVAPDGFECGQAWDER